MVLPPNRPGLVLGPDGRTLTDLYNQLGDLTLAIEQSNVYLSQIVGRLDAAQSINGSANALLTDIRNGIGTVGSTPANYTVKRLLALIQECICEAPPDITFNPTPPEVGCFGSAPNWQECSLELRLDQGPGGNRVYKVVFPSFLTNDPRYGGALIGGTNEPALVELDTAPFTGNVRVCLQWAFSDETPLYNYGWTASEDVVSLTPYNSYSQVTGTAPNAGGELIVIPPGASGGTVRCGAMANFAFDTGVIPVGKVWVSIEEP